MRESNFAFPAQNRACVCISSQLYDRRALDTTSPLPLFNSLTHLTYLTSTSPRIREILTADGGLERLVRLLRDFCAHPPPPESPAQFYGLQPPNLKSHVPAHAPYDPKRPFDRAAAYRFSLAFQCVVNIGVRGSEPIRARVVQAGTLDVVGCVLEAWLSSKGFAVAPSVSASGMPRESREQRHARRLAAAEMRHRELQAQELARQLHHHVGPHQDEDVDADMLDATPTPSDQSTAFVSSSYHTPSSAQPTSASDTSNDTSPTSTPRRAGTPTATVGVPVRDRSGTIIARVTADVNTHIRRRSTVRATVVAPSVNTAAAAAAAARTDTEPESDADAEMDDATGAQAPSTGAPAPAQQGRRAVGIVGDDDATALEVDMNLDMLLAGATDGFVALDPAGADALPLAATHDDRAPREEDRTPRAAFARLPDTHPAPPPVAVPTAAASGQPPPAHTHDSGPYREEDVLLSLQLLAYLSKYPHVRQAFYKPRAVFNPALQAMQTSVHSSAPKDPAPSGNFFRVLAGAAVGRSKDKDKYRGPVVVCTSDSSPSRPARPLTQSTNVFSLVERFTFRPSPTETQQLPSPPPLLPPEIQYWAGVIMRNACRKDESRGGIRQCANMLCGKWESFPREFAKCRRCRKAKYCGKECQSRAWAEGHRFWCSAREEEAEAPGTAVAAEGAEGAREGSAAREEGAAVGVVRPRGERVRVAAEPRAGPSRQPPAAAVAGPTRMATRATHATTLYRAGPEATGRGPPSGHATYTRSRVNASVPPPQPPPQGPHAPYLHMTGTVPTATARRRSGTMPGPSVSTADLPGSLHDDGAGGPRRRRAGPDDMVLG